MIIGSNLPEVPGGLPVLGHTWTLLRRPMALLASVPTHCDLVQIRLGSLRAVMVCSPELVAQVLTDDRTFDKTGGLFERDGRSALGDGLATCPYSRHRRQRRLIQPAFHRSRLPHYAVTMAEQADTVCRGWSEGQVVDVPREMKDITLRSLSATLFAGTLTASEALSLADLDTIMAGIYRATVIPPWLARLPTPSNLRFRRVSGRVHKHLRALIAERRREDVDRGDLLSALLAARDPESTGVVRGLTDNEIGDQVVTFFVAGTETSAATVSWALHLLARHPAVQARVYAEIDAALAGGPLGSGGLDRLKLTGWVIAETLRLYPLPWLCARSVTSDTRLGRYTLSAGTTVVYAPFVIHHQKEVYEHPDRFDPDRWDTARPQPPRHSYIPFGGGARKCIGDEFGTLQATLVLATVLARWRLDHVPGPPVRPTLSIVPGPGNLRMRATMRTS
ncbi:cytochrome P450 [Streptomyces sp. NPDC016172]|uniref:cytochrome P450 n=1 Tax=Streptomyces sp. NPDC016172 TaxID=3364964 RepID=UPI0036FD97A8